MVITKRGYGVTIICDEPTSEHLIPNLSALKAECFGVTQMKGYVKNSAKDTQLIKAEFYGEMGALESIIDYVKQHYIERYPVYMTMVEARQPV